MSLNLNPIGASYDESDSDHDGEIADTVPSSLDVSTSSSANNNNHYLTPRKGAGALLNTSSFARRLADGSPTPHEQGIAKQASGEMDGAEAPHSPDSGGSATSSVTSFKQCPQEVISSDIKRGIHIPTDSDITDATSVSNKTSEGGGDDSMVEATAKAVVKSESDNMVKDEPKAMPATEAKPANENKASAVPQAQAAPLPLTHIRGPALTPTRNNHNNNNHNNAKNPFDAFGEYITCLFQKAEVLEEELEHQQSRRDLQANNMDRTHHGMSKRNIIEGGGSTSSDEESSSLDGNGKMDVTTSGVKPDPRDALSNMTQLKAEHSFGRGDEAHDQKKQKIVDVTPPNVPVVVVDEATKKQWKDQWEEFVADKKKNKFKEVAIESLAIPLSVDEFYHFVLEDNATHSLEKFMIDIGELKVGTTPWEPSEMPTATEPTSRTIQYTHPVNAPMAPPTAKARKQQSLRKFGNVGLCLETCTVVEEVPMADCFVVDDRIWVHEAEGENKGGCIVAVTFNIRFVKGTMFRRIIENTTRKEYASFWDQFADMVKSLKSPLALEEEELEEVAMELEVATALLDEQGQEVSLSSSVLDRIRTSSRRLSEVAQLSPRPSTKKLAHFEEEKEEPTGFHMQMVKGVLDVIGYLKKELSEGDYGFAVACTIIFFLVLLNMLALRQMMNMNGFLHNLDARLEKMNEINEMLALKLANSGSVDAASCPG